MSFEYNSRSNWPATQPNQHRQASWTSNGRQFSVRTTSYSIPNGHFASFSGSMGPSNVSQPHSGSGFMKTAFALLNGMLASQTADSGRSTQASNRHATVQDGEYEGLDYGDPPAGFGGERDSPFVEMHPRSTPEKKYRRSRGASPSRSHRRSHTSPGHRSGFQSHRARTSSPDTSDSNAQYRDTNNNREDGNLGKLRQHVENQRKAAREARKSQRDAEWNRNVTQAELEAAMEQNQAAERAYKDARDKLRAAEAEARTERHSRRRGAARERPSRHQPFEASSTDDFHRFAFGDSDDDDFFNSFGSFGAFSQFPNSRFANSRRAGFDRFQSGNLFASDSSRDFPSIHQFHHFNTIPQGFFGFNSIFDDLPELRPRSHQRPRHTHRSQQGTTPAPSFAQSQRPLLNLITPKEAKNLFNVYNERWNALSSTDPNIAWPARGSDPNALSARDTIWAPAVSSPVSTWSDEVVMKANVQAFFLGAVDLSPMYTEVPGTGQVQAGFDKSRASPAQLDMLLSMLKKERTRWHSDRLGRRNMGLDDDGPNVKLQRDERARAVFHAVCELLDAAQ